MRVADEVTHQPREVGYAMAAGDNPMADDNWELQFPRAAWTFAKMGREDAQVASLLNAINLPIRRAEWRVAGNGAPDEIVRHVADDLRLRVQGDDPTRPIPPQAGKVSWSEHLQKALLAVQHGHMFFEQVYAPGDDGREHLVKLAPRYPGSIHKINVARDGGLDSIEQRPVPEGGRRKSRPIKIPVSRLVAYVREPQDSSWHGTSILRPAYKHWVMRDELLRLELQILDRNGMGIPVYRGSEFTDDPKGDMLRGQALAEALRSGATSGAAIPYGADLTVQGVSGQLVSPREAIAYHDSMIARSALAHFLNLEGKGGSYSLAETQSDLFIQALQTTAEWIRDTANQHVVEDLVRVAFPEYNGPAPLIVFDPIASKKELSAQDLRSLVDAGVILPDLWLEEEIRSRFLLPAKRPIEDAIASGDFDPNATSGGSDGQGGNSNSDDNVPGDSSPDGAQGESIEAILGRAILAAMMNGGTDG